MSTVSYRTSSDRQLPQPFMPSTLGGIDMYACSSGRVTANPACVAGIMLDWVGILMVLNTPPNMPSMCCCCCG